MHQIAPPPALSARAAGEIRAAILNGSLAPGSRIRQEDLAAKLGVSREPVRHALLVLEREGLVLSVAKHGVIVAPVDLQLISEVYEFREAVEGHVAAKVAAQKDFDPTTLRGIIARGERAARAGAIDRLIELDLAFHCELYRASGNHVVVDVMRTQWAHIRRVMETTLSIRSYRNQAWAEHKAILEAIVRRQAPRARALAAAHTQRARLFLTARLQAKDAQPHGVR